jgi:hypothetical protein
MLNDTQSRRELSRNSLKFLEAGDAAASKAPGMIAVLHKVFDLLDALQTAVSCVSAGIK